MTLLLAIFITKRLPAIYVACVSGGVRGGGGVGGRGWGFGKGRKGTPVIRPPPPPSPIIEKRETLIQPEVMTI